MPIAPRHWSHTGPLNISKSATLTVKACGTLKHLHWQKFYFHRCLCIRNKLQAEIFSRGWRIVEQMQQHIFQLMHLQNVNPLCWLMQFSCRILPLFGVFIYFLIVNLIFVSAHLVFRDFFEQRFASIFFFVRIMRNKRFSLSSGGWGQCLWRGW